MRAVCLAIVASLCCSCGFFRWDKPNFGSSCPPNRGDLLEVVTMNAGLAPGVVAMTTPRVEPFARSIGQYRGAGLICLQEVWTQPAVDAVIRELNLPPDRVFHADTRGQGEQPGTNVCSLDQVEGLRACTERRCRGVPAEDSAICARSLCYHELVRVYLKHRRCMNCLVASVGGSIESMTRDCVGGAGRSRVYGGQNGVILASRWPLLDREVVDLPSSGANRVALLAGIEVGGRRIEVSCTHLSTTESVAPTDPRFRNWYEEQAAQIEVITRRLKERARGRPMLFLGDLNAGPDLDERVHGSCERTWVRLMRKGFVCPAAHAEPPFCSLCGGNNLRGRARVGYLIDHVLVGNDRRNPMLVPVCAHPILDRKVMIRGYRGDYPWTNLSDHYGVMVKFRIR